MSAKIEYRNGYFYIDVPVEEAYEDENLRRFLQDYPQQNDILRPASRTVRGRQPEDERTDSAERWYDREIF